MHRAAVHGSRHSGLVHLSLLPDAEELHISREQMEIPDGITTPDWMALQRQFLDEGIETSRELLARLDDRFDALKASRQMHRWAGSAGQLGFHNVTEAARRVERSLGGPPLRQADVRERLGDLLLAFSDHRDKLMGGVPDHVAEVLRGKSVAVLGLPPARTELLCSALQRAGARPRLFPAAEDLGCESVRDCDLVMVHVRPGADSRKLQAAAMGPVAGKLFLAGDRCHLTALPPGLQALVADFLFDGWEAEELLLRLALAIWRKPGSSAAMPEKAGSRAGEICSGVTNPRIVAVDDDPIVLAVLRATFRIQGMQCEAVDNGGDALRLVREFEPHVVVLDVNMPGMDGFEVLSAIRDEGLPTLVVLLTARQQEPDVLRGFQLGADDYLVKPFNPPELVARIKRLLGHTRKSAA
jgi:CheY-like chemotaxis protein